MKKIIKSIPMMTFIIIFLGLITVNSFTEKNTKKDLNHANESSQSKL